MKDFIVLFREPDGRSVPHTAEETARHQANWKAWFEKYGPTGKLAGGKGMSLSGKVISPDGELIEGPHKVGLEIVGGFLLLKAENLDEAVQITQSCPIFEFGGYAEVRELNS